MKPVRLLCYMSLLASWTWPCTTFNSIPIILNLLTNRSIALIYSVTICERKTKDCARSGQLWCSLAFLKPVSSTMPLAAKRATWTNFVAKSRSTLSFLQQLFEPCNKKIWCKTGLNMGGKTRNIAFQLIFQQCCKTGCTLGSALYNLSYNAAKQVARSGLHCIIYLNCRITFSCYEEILVSFPMYSRTQRGACKSDWVEAWRPGCWS